MKFTANVALAMALGVMLLSTPTSTPTPTPPIPPVGGLGAVVVDLPDDHVAAFASFIANRGGTFGGVTVTVADDFMCSVKGNTLTIHGGLRVAGKVLGVPVGTTVNTVTVGPGRVVVDLNKVPIDIILK